MSLSLIKPYLRARCLAVGLAEHPEPFNQENLPSTIIDKSFQISLTSANGVKLNQNDQEMSSTVGLIFYLKGFRDPDLALDKAIEKSEALIREVEKPVNRLGVCLKNVSLSDINYEALALSNDNVVKTTINFNFVTNLNL